MIFAWCALRLDKIWSDCGLEACGADGKQADVSADNYRCVRCQYDVSAADMDRLLLPQSDRKYPALQRQVSG